MAEAVWVLERTYGVAHQDIAACWRSHHWERAAGFRRHDHPQRGGGARFADALIAALGVRAGCSSTLTF